MDSLLRSGEISTTGIVVAEVTDGEVQTVKVQ
jgi:hypothetical protein